MDTMIESDPSAIGWSQRLYLTRRRHELLAPVRALMDIAGLLQAEETLNQHDVVRSDLGTIRETGQRIIQMVDQQLHPKRVGLEVFARALNHDLRSLLTIVIGYADELKRAARKGFLDPYLSEIDQIRALSHCALALVDSTVTHLRSAGAGQEVTDDVWSYINRGDCGDFLAVADEPDQVAAEPGLILVAEDSPKIRELLADQLRRQGHEVVATCDGVEAMMVVGSRPFDLVLTDLEMPRANGFQLLEHLRNDPEMREIPVVVISGHSDLEGIAHCIKHGAEDYLPKPFNSVLLRARVEACLEKKRLRDRAEHQRRRYNELLNAILPAPIVTELERSDSVPPRRHDEAAVLFADIVGFTSYCDGLLDDPEAVVNHLGRMFETWEEIAGSFGVQKIKTIGDAFMGAAGLLMASDNPVLDCVRCGLNLIRFTRSQADDRGVRLPFNLRVGVHIGPVVAGLLGRRQSLYDLWGDTVNIASRLESHGLAGAVNLSTAAWSRVAGQITGESRSIREVKGKPLPLEMIHLDPDQVRVLGLD